jgi:hypothetical protein
MSSATGEFLALAAIIERAHTELDDNPLAPKREELGELCLRIDRARDKACTIIEDQRAEIERLKAINVGVGKTIVALRTERDNWRQLYQTCAGVAS